MELNLNKDIQQLLSAFILIIIPLVILILGAIVGLKNAGYFIITIMWFGIGVIFFGIIH